MSEDKPLDLARSLLSATLAERNRAFTQSLKTIIADQAFKGSIRSGGTLIRLGRQAETEIRERANYIVEIARRILGDERRERIDELVRSFKAHAEDVVGAAYAETWGIILQLGPVKDMQTSNPRAVQTIEWQVSEVRNEQIEKCRAEIELVSRAIRAQRPIPVGGGHYKIAVIVALDVAGYSARTEANESIAIDDVTRLRDTIREVAEARGGRVFNTAGDGFMLEFVSATDGVEAARLLASECEPKMRIGVHVGEVKVGEDGDLLGHAVNVAARLMQGSEAGSALVSVDVRRMIRSSINGLSADGRILPLEKMKEKIEVYELIGY